MEEASELKKKKTNHECIQEISLKEHNKVPTIKKMTIKKRQPVQLEK